VPAEGNDDLQTLICVLVARLRRCPTLSNPVLWQSWMAACPGYTLQMRMLFPGWPIMVHEMRMRKRGEHFTICVPYSSFDDVDLLHGIPPQQKHPKFYDGTACSSSHADPAPRLSRDLKMNRSRHSTTFRPNITNPSMSQ